MPRPVGALAEKFGRIRPHLNEASLRLWAANEALSLGYGGVSEVSRATQLSRTTIHAGIAELESAAVAHESNRIRRSGGGRKKLTDKDPGLLGALNKLVDSSDARRPRVPPPLDKQEHDQTGPGTQHKWTPCLATHGLRFIDRRGLFSPERT